KKVLWLGDSVAEVESHPLRAAMEANGVTFESAASDGGGNIVEGDINSPDRLVKGVSTIAKETWKTLPAKIDSFHPNVIAYKIATYDWGTSEQQRSSYQKLVNTAKQAGAELVIVPADPFKIDDFYKPGEAGIRSAPKVAKEVADSNKETVHFFDSEALWGTDWSASKALRSKDGIHTCQQGAAAYAKWFTERLGEQYGFTPVDASKWATGSWTSDKVFAKNDCK
ncbi:MAG: hypothetical protein QOE71_231, partial [Pseudonocardiales bacterium]|nr:hypothetical protein [Pseudonocardiales bacterium]